MSSREVAQTIHFRHAFWASSGMHEIRYSRYSTTAQCLCAVLGLLWRVKLIFTAPANNPCCLNNPCSKAYFLPAASVLQCVAVCCVAWFCFYKQSSSHWKRIVVCNIVGFFFFTTNHTNRNGSTRWGFSLRPLPLAQSLIPKVQGLALIPLDIPKGRNLNL